MEHGVEEKLLATVSWFQFMTDCYNSLQLCSSLLWFPYLALSLMEFQIIVTTTHTHTHSPSPSLPFSILHKLLVWTSKDRRIFREREQPCLSHRPCCLLPTAGLRSGWWSGTVALSKRFSYWWRRVACEQRSNDCQFECHGRCSGSGWPLLLCGAHKCGSTGFMCSYRWVSTLNSGLFSRVQGSRL